MSDPYLDDQIEGRIQFGFLRRLCPFVRPYRRGFALCLLILLVSFVLEMLGPWLLRGAIDGPMRDADADGDARLQSLVWYGLGFLGATGGGAVLGYVYGLVTAWNGQRVIRDVRRRLFSHLLSTGLSFHERNPAGKLTTRISSDVENLNELIATGVLQSVFDLLKIVGVLVVLFFLDVHLALFTVATTPVVIAISVLFRRNAQRAYRAVRGRLALQNAFGLHRGADRRRAHDARVRPRDHGAAPLRRTQPRDRRRLARHGAALLAVLRAGRLRAARDHRRPVVVRRQRGARGHHATGPVRAVLALLRDVLQIGRAHV